MKRATASFSREPVVFESLPKPFYCQVTNTLTGMERRDAAFASLKKKEGRRRRRRRRRRWRRRMKFPGGFFFSIPSESQQQSPSTGQPLLVFDGIILAAICGRWIRFLHWSNQHWQREREREKSSKSSSVMSNINTVGFYCVRVCVCVWICQVGFRLS